MRWPKYRNFSLTISPSNENPGPISFETDWLDLLAVQGILKNLLQHHNSKASILLIDRVPDELWTEAHDILQESGIKTIPLETKCEKAKWLSGEALQLAV